MPVAVEMPDTAGSLQQQRRSIGRYTRNSRKCQQFVSFRQYLQKEVEIAKIKYVKKA
jgi:hypothetical protein